MPPVNPKLAAIAALLQGSAPQQQRPSMSPGGSMVPGAPSPQDNSKLRIEAQLYNWPVAREPASMLGGGERMRRAGKII